MFILIFCSVITFLCGVAVGYLLSYEIAWNKGYDFLYNFMKEKMLENHN